MLIARPGVRICCDITDGGRETMAVGVNSGGAYNGEYYKLPATKRKDGTLVVVNRMMNAGIGVELTLPELAGEVTGK